MSSFKKLNNDSTVIYQRLLNLYLNGNFAEAQAGIETNDLHLCKKSLILARLALAKHDYFEFQEQVFSLTRIFRHWIKTINHDV